MDLDHIRAMVESGDFTTTYELDARMSQREFSLDNLIEVLRTGRIVREESRKRGGPKCTIRGYSRRTVAGLELPGSFELEVAVGVDEDVIFITAYWLE